MTIRFYARSSFWLAYTNNSRSCLTLMTSEFRRFVGRKCSNGCLVLHVRRDEFTELVARWKQDFPSLKVLRYAKIQRINNSALVGASFFDTAWENRFEWCILREPRLGETEPQPRYVDGFLWMNITNTQFRQAIVKHLANEVRNSVCDGLGIDSHHWDLTDPGNIVGGAELNAIWQAGARAVLEELKDELGPNYTIMFNGLWGFKGEEQAVEQGEMLGSADGISVEFFGVDGHGPAGSEMPGTEWQLFVGNLNTQLAAAGRGKYAVVNGQRLSGVYADYRDDYAAAMYCYANFLLGPIDPKHGFHYGNFQCTKTPKERTGGYDYFDFQDLRLGRPLQDVVKASVSGKARVFEGGVVLVAPTASRTQSFILERRYYTMAGHTVDPGERKIRPGTAEILLAGRPAPPAATLDVYGGGRGAWTKTEWMVQPVKSGWYRYKILNLRVQSTDLASAILIRVEIDHDPITHGIVVIRPVDGTFTKTTKDYPYTETPNGTATNEYASATYTTDNAAKNLSLKLDGSIGRTCYRVVSIRVIGSVQVSLITLSEKTAI